MPKQQTVKLTPKLAHFEAARREINRRRKTSKLSKLSTRANVALAHKVFDEASATVFVDNYGGLMGALRKMTSAEIHSVPGFDQDTVTAVVTDFLAPKVVVESDTGPVLVIESSTAPDPDPEPEPTVVQAFVPGAVSTAPPKAARAKFNLTPEQIVARDFITKNVAQKGAEYHRACAAAGIPTRHGVTLLSSWDDGKGTIHPAGSLVYGFDLPEDRCERPESVRKVRTSKAKNAKAVTTTSPAIVLV